MTKRGAVQKAVAAKREKTGQRAARTWKFSPHESLDVTFTAIPQSQSAWRDRLALAKSLLGALLVALPARRYGKKADECPTLRDAMDKFDLVSHDEHGRCVWTPEEEPVAGTLECKFAHRANNREDLQTACECSIAALDVEHAVNVLVSFAAGLAPAFAAHGTFPETVCAAMTALAAFNWIQCRIDRVVDVKKHAREDMVVAMMTFMRMKAEAITPELLAYLRVPREIVDQWPQLRTHTRVALALALVPPAASLDLLLDVAGVPATHRASRAQDWRRLCERRGEPCAADGPRDKYARYGLAFKDTIVDALAAAYACEGRDGLAPLFSYVVRCARRDAETKAEAESASV